MNAISVLVIVIGVIGIILLTYLLIFVIALVRTFTSAEFIHTMSTLSKDDDPPVVEIRRPDGKHVTRH